MVGTGICQTLFSFYCLPCYTFPTQIIKSKSKLVEFGFDVIDGVKLLNAIQQGLIEEMKEMRNKGHIATRIREVKQTQKTEGKFLGGLVIVPFCKGVISRNVMQPWPSKNLTWGATN
jgi:hypothetical protein